MIGVPRIRRQIDHDLIQMAGICFNDGGGRSRQKDYLHVVSHERTQQLAYFPEALVQIQQLGLQWLTAAEGQQLPS